jgi:hypothetical protein
MIKINVRPGGTLPFGQFSLLYIIYIETQFTVLQIRYHVRSRNAYIIEANDVVSDAIECPACPKV